MRFGADMIIWRMETHFGYPCPILHSDLCSWGGGEGNVTREVLPKPDRQIILDWIHTNEPGAIMGEGEGGKDGNDMASGSSRSVKLFVACIYSKYHVPSAAVNKEHGF